MFDIAQMDELAMQAKSGNQSASDRLLEMAYSWVSWIIHDKNWFPPPGTERQDLVQEGVVGAFHALEDWRPELQSFTSFGRMAVERWLMTHFKMATRQKHKPLNERVSLDAPAHRDKHAGADQDSEDRLSTWNLPDTSGMSADPADVVVASWESRHLMDSLCGSMTDLERSVFELVIVNKTQYEEAAAHLGTGPKSVDNALQRIKRKLVALAMEVNGGDHSDSVLSSALAGLAGRRRLTDDELRDTLPVEVLRPACLARFQSVHLQWTVAPDRILVEYPDIHQYATSPEKQSVLAAYMDWLPWKEIAGQCGITVSAAKHHLRRMCEKAARARGLIRTMTASSTPLQQRVEQLWLRGTPIKEMISGLSGVATEQEVKQALARLHNRVARKRLKRMPEQVEMRRIPMVRLNRIPHLLTKAKPLLIPEHLMTLKLYMQGYSQPEIAQRRDVAPSSIGKNDLPVIRRTLRDVKGFEWLYDPQVRERQARLTALAALGITPEEAMEQVPAKHREMFSLYLDGLLHREIDKRLGLKADTTMKALHYCRSCLRRPDHLKDRSGRHDVPERTAARRRRAIPDTYTRFKALGHLLDGDRQKLLTEWFAGTSTGAIAEMFGRPDNTTGRGCIFARVQRAGELLQQLEETQVKPVRLAREA